MTQGTCLRCGSPRPPRSRKWCASCKRSLKLEGKRRYNARPETRERQRQWWQDHPERKAEYRERYRDREREQQRAYREATADHIRERNARWRAENPDYHRQWWAANPVRALEYSRRNSPIRRARKLSLPAESINPLEIYDRDGWRCGLCGGRVARSVKHPDPMSASLDHIVPLSRGGHHVRANVQLAHLFCNMSKHTNAANEQLRLLG